MRQDSAILATPPSGMRQATGLEIICHSGQTVEANLALDARFAQESGRTGRRVLRLWWGADATAVLGCGDRPEAALHLDACALRGVGWVKRVTGGGTVLQTPGVLNYSYTAPDSGRIDIAKTFEQGAEFVRNGLAELGVAAQRCGTSDVAVGDRKISGNAQARKWRSILLHGTVLVDIDFDLVEAVLRHPEKEPEYRMRRSHSDFMITLRKLGVTASTAEIESAFARAAAVLRQA